MTGGIDVKVDASDLRKLYVDLKGVPGNLRVELRRGIRDAAKPMVRDVQAAASWSSRIPGSIKVKPSFAARGAGVAIVADPKIAPEAAPLNNKDQSGTFRHPVFGNRDNWVAQQARPFFHTAAMQGASAAEQAIVAVMDRVAKAAGFR